MSIVDVESKDQSETNPELWDNPAGTDGFEFVEYAAPYPKALAALFEQMGFTAVARHRSKDVALFRQGDLNFIINAEPESFAQSFARVHGPCVCAIPFRVQDAPRLTSGPWPTAHGRIWQPSARWNSTSPPSRESAAA